MTGQSQILEFLCPRYNLCIAYSILTDGKNIALCMYQIEPVIALDTLKHWLYIYNKQ